MAYQRGSGFVGLQQYLNANQQQGSAMGGAVAGRLESDIEKASAVVRSGLDDAVAGVQSAATAGTPTYVEPTSKEEAEAKAGGQGTIYTGPQGLSAAQVNTAQQGIDAIGEQGRYGQTDAGVATLLQQQYGKGYTGVGGRALDSALVRRGAGERLDTAGPKGMEGLKSYLGTSNAKAIEAGEQGSMNAAGVRNQYANWQPAQMFGEQRRNPIQTHGTMPAPAKKKGTFFDNLGHRLFGGG